MKHIILAFALLFVIPAITAFAVEIGGAWRAQMPSFAGAGPRAVVFKFNVDGKKLKGVISGIKDNEVAISDGRISGEYLYFAVDSELYGNPVRLLHAGKISGDEIRFLMRPEGAPNTEEFTAKRIS